MVEKRKEKGIRNIKIKGKNVRFKKGVRFKYIKSKALKTQKVFQERGHLTRIIPTKKKINHKTYHGYYVWLSEKRIREKGLKW